MEIHLADWHFLVDLYATEEYTLKCSMDHCNCPYCQNYYENAHRVQPELSPVLAKFGIFFHGPCEVMPFEPTLVAACYRVTGKILRKGNALLHVNGAALRPEEADDRTFFLWVGPIELPWTQNTAVEDVISPANEPDFMDRMMQRLLTWAEADELDS